MPSRCESRLTRRESERRSQCRGRASLSRCGCDRRIRALPCRGRAEPCRATAAHSLAAPSLNRAVLSEPSQCHCYAPPRNALAARSCADLAAALRRLTKRCHSIATLPSLHLAIAMFRPAAASPFLATALLRQPMRTQGQSMLCLCFALRCRALPLPRRAARCNAIALLRRAIAVPCTTVLRLSGAWLCGTERPCPVP